MGLLVLVILGNTERHLFKPSFLNPAVKTVIGNKRIGNLQNDYPGHIKFFDEWVLQESRQCLPLLQFDASLISTIFDRHAGNDAIWSYHQELHKILDRFFNGGHETRLTRITPGMCKTPAVSQTSQFIQPSSAPTTGSQAAIGFSTFTAFPSQTFTPFAAFGPGSTNMTGPAGGAIHWQMPHFTPFSTTTTAGSHAAHAGSTPSKHLPLPVVATTGNARGFLAFAGAGSASGTVIGRESLVYKAPQSLDLFASSEDAFVSCAHEIGSSEECPICLEALYGRETVLRLRICSHRFHVSCIRDSLNAANKCPLCRKHVGDPRGKCPSGNMDITSSPTPCSGFDHDPSIVVVYNMPSGIQMPYHENPGLPFKGTNRFAYLPDNQEGRRLLERLKWAWMHGLTFSVGTSLTTGRPNCVIWSSIHHKTSQTPGPHGFPDPDFFANCNQELDSLDVPKAS